MMRMLAIAAVWGAFVALLVFVSERAKAITDATVILGRGAAIHFEFADTIQMRGLFRGSDGNLGYQVYGRDATVHELRAVLSDAEWAAVEQQANRWLPKATHGWAYDPKAEKGWVAY